MVESEPEDPSISDIRNRVRAFAGTGPQYYEQLRARLKSLDTAVREEIARAIEPAINERVKTMPQATPEERRELAQWLNSELRSIARLAIRDHDSGQASTIFYDNKGRWRFIYRDLLGNRHQPTGKTTLPYLDLLLEDSRLSRQSTPHRSL